VPGEKNVAEGDPLATVGGHFPTFRKKLRNDNESGCRGCLY